MKNLLLKVAVPLLVVIAFAAWWLTRTDTSARARRDATRQSLRQQGFKTELADFDFSTAPAVRSREAVLTGVLQTYRFEPTEDLPILREAAGGDAVIVQWRQDSLTRTYPSWPNPDATLSWDEFRDALSADQEPFAAACDAVLSGPIAFNLNARAGSAMLLPHLSLLKKFSQMLGSRTLLALHDGRRDAAWTNLLAATRLVTAWEPEPAEVSHLVRFVNTELTFDTLWEALQYDGWTDEQLAQLQREWESVDYFHHLPEIMAFKRACFVAVCEQQRTMPAMMGLTPGQFFAETLHHPLSAWTFLKARWQQHGYLTHGIYEDEMNLLLFYRDRELEYRQAVAAPTWSQMSGRPGVTNTVSFSSPYHSPALTMMLMHEHNLALLSSGTSFLGRAAEAEARRRLLVTALALARYHGQHGSYPTTLAGLTPEFLKTVPVDFMDGQPLRYRLAVDGHFTLYSAGLDGVDHGGGVLTRAQSIQASRTAARMGLAPAADLVWPRPATAAEVAALRQSEQYARQVKSDETEDLQARAQWDTTRRHQADAGRLLAAPAPPPPHDERYHGRPLSQVLRNPGSAGTNRLTLGELLTLRPVLTGAEPETITFEAPIAYNVITNYGDLCLFVDTNNDDSDDGCNAQLLECNRADNGDCLLVWHTIFEAPGRHALQMGLTLDDEPTNLFTGPYLPFEITNLCQFSVASAHFDQDAGATFHAQLPEANARYTIELNTTNGVRLKTLTGATTTGELKEHWDLLDDQGRRFTGDYFNTVFHLTLPDSGRTQTLNGP